MKTKLILLLFLAIVLDAPASTPINNLKVGGNATFSPGSTIDYANTTVLNFPLPTVSNSIFVSQASGNNSNSGTLMAPKLTLANAKSAATTGKTIVVLDGTFNENNLANNLVDWLWYPGTGVNYTGSSTLAIYDDAGGAMTFKVTGWGSFIHFGTGSESAVVSESNANSSIYFDAYYAKAANTVDTHSGANTFKLVNGKFVAHVSKIEMLSAGASSNCIYWELGPAEITADEIRVLDGGAAADTANCVWGNPQSTPNGQLYVQSQLYENLSTSANGQHSIIYSTGNSAQRIWTSGKQYIGASSQSARAINVGAGFAYVDGAEKIIGQIANNGAGSTLYLHSQKQAMPTGSTVEHILNLGQGFINIYELDDTGVASASLVNNSGTLTLGGPCVIARTTTGTAIINSGAITLASVVISGVSGGYDIQNTGTATALGSKWNNANVSGNPIQFSTIGNSFRLTPAGAPSSPTEGTVYANSSDHHLYFYNGTTWKQLDN
jgi:hypothetical protein